MRPRGSDPTVVGALVLVAENDVLGDAPLYTYAGNIRSGKAVLGVSLTGGAQAVRVRILFSHARENASLSTSAKASIVAPARFIGVDTARYSFHQSHQREIVAVDVAIAAGARVSVSCDVPKPPDLETCTSCRMAFAPPLSRDILALASRGGFNPIMPVMANIQRVPQSTGFSTTGGRRVHDHVLGSITEASYLDANDPILRAFWADEPKRSWQSFWLFFLAAISRSRCGHALRSAAPVYRRPLSGDGFRWRLWPLARLRRQARRGMLWAWALPQRRPLVCC